MTNYIIKLVENTTLPIDCVEKMDIMHIEDAIKISHDTFVKFDGFPSNMKEGFHNHYSNKGHNAIIS